MTEVIDAEVFPAVLSADLIAEKNIKYNMKRLANENAEIITKILKFLNKAISNNFEETNNITEIKKPKKIEVPRKFIISFP